MAVEKMKSTKADQPARIESTHVRVYNAYKT
jgi:hypothetical protein